jgi:hypothetical protein
VPARYLKKTPSSCKALRTATTSGALIISTTRYPPNLCSGLQLGPVPDEVVRPAVVSRMEKANNLSGVRIKPSHVRPLEAIAMDTGEGEILKFSFATMLSCDDVIDLEGRRMKN